MKIDLNCPVECQGCLVKSNASTGELYAMFKLYNLSDREVDGVKLEISCYDSYGGQLAVIPASLEGLAAQPHDFFAANKAVSLQEHPDTKRAMARIAEVAFADGEVYVPQNEIEVHTQEPEPELMSRLKRTAGSEAVCFAAEHGDHWVCVCGRANLPDTEFCIRCGNQKEEMLQKFSSVQTVNEQVILLGEQEEAERQQQLAAEQERLREQREKQKKQLKLAGIVAAAVVVVALLGLLGYRGVVSLMAGSSAGRGDGAKAYALYQSIGSKKAYDVQDAARGNSISNTLASGFAATDGEYLYFLDDSMNICRQKAEGNDPAESLGVSGIYINVSGDWLYYLDTGASNVADARKICRVKKDGSERSVVSDDQAVTFTLIGEDIYYANASAGYQVYRMKTDGTHKRQISVAPAMTGTNGQASSFIAVYRDTVYFVGQNGGLMRVGCNGKNEETVISTPVVNFGIHNDVIYYSDGNAKDQVSGNPKYPLMKCALDGSSPEPVREDCQIPVMNLTDEGIYYLDFSAGLLVGFMDYDAGNQRSVLDQPCGAFNVTGDWVYYQSLYGFARVKKDGSATEAIGTIATTAPGVSAAASTAAPAE